MVHAMFMPGQVRHAQLSDWTSCAQIALRPGLGTAGLLPLVPTVVLVWPSCQGATDQVLSIPVLSCSPVHSYLEVSPTEYHRLISK